MDLPLVTIVIPVYRRLALLPGALASVAAQDYPNLELIVSDNGVNGDAVPSIVQAHYQGPHICRQNPATVPVVAHLNQLLSIANGKYFVLLCDDDEISPRFVADLVERLERDPKAHVGVARAATMDENGEHRETVSSFWPECLSAPEFIRAWASKRVRLVSTVTHLSRTASARACGGYADFPRGLYSDNLLLLKLALLGNVALGQHCTFTWRIDDASTGYSATYHEVAGSCRGFLHALDHDQDIARYAAADQDWPELRAHLRDQCGAWYFHRWRDRYRDRLTTAQWVRASCALPFIPSYYKRVWNTLAECAKAPIRNRLPRLVQIKRQFRQ